LESSPIAAKKNGGTISNVEGFDASFDMLVTPYGTPFKGSVQNKRCKKTDENECDSSGE